MLKSVLMVSRSEPRGQVEPPYSFAERLAYLRLLYAIGRLRPESDKDLALRAGIGYEWLRKWMKRDDAPKGRADEFKLADALGGYRDWLLEGEGEPPNPSLWQLWLTAPSAEPSGTARGKESRRARRRQKP